MAGRIGGARRFANEADETAYLDDLAIQLVGDSTYRGIAFGLIIVLFNIWDRIIDPAHADRALLWRIAGCIAIAVVHGLWIRARRKTYRLYSRLVLTHSITVPLCVSGAIGSLEGGILNGLTHLLFIYMWLPSVLPERRACLLGSVFSTTVIIAVAVISRPGGVVVGDTIFFALLGAFMSLAIATKFEAALRRAWSQEQAAMREARTDPLTGAVNRRQFSEAAAAEKARTIRYGRAGAMILFDLDHFKKINDTFGHAAGDAALCEVVAVCAEEIRRIDVLARLGGEEFAVLVPETSMDEAVALAERLRKRIAAIDLAVPQGSLRVTASFGVAPLPPDDGSWEASSAAADSALYRAKQSGRNQVAAETFPETGAALAASPG